MPRKYNLKRLNVEWYGRPKETLEYFKAKYGVKVMREIADRVLKR